MPDHVTPRASRQQTIGFAGSGLVHAIGAAVLVSPLTFGTIFADPVPSYTPPGAFAVRAGPVFEVFTPPVTANRTPPTPRSADCGRPRSDVGPTLRGDALVGDGWPHARAPRLCIRINREGRVLAARVLRSIGSTATDCLLGAEDRGPALRVRQAGPPGGADYRHP